jgi:hypothetical protein
MNFTFRHVTGVIKSRRKRRVGHLARAGKIKMHAELWQGKEIAWKTEA